MSVSARHFLKRTRSIKPLLRQQILVKVITPRQDKVPQQLPESKPSYRQMPRTGFDEYSLSLLWIAAHRLNAFKVSRTFAGFRDRTVKVFVDKSTSTIALSSTRRIAFLIAFTQPPQFIFGTLNVYIWHILSIVEVSL